VSALGWSRTAVNAIAKARSLKLTTTGRRSGKPHTVTLWFVSHQGKVYVSSDDFQRRDWCRNILACPEVRVVVGGVELKGTARPVDNPAQREEIKRLRYERYHRAFMGMAKQFVEISLQEL
jgi:deazaflavin-dependent oxidoreductase (nitroreductase family)